MASPEVTDDGKYLIITISKGTDDKYRVLYRPLDRPDAPLVHLVGDFEADYSFIDNDGPVFWFKTNKDAPRGKVVAIDTRDPAPGRWVELIPQAAETLEQGLGGRRSLHRRLPEGRAHGRPRHRPERPPRPRGRVPRPGHGRRVRRQAEGQGDVLRLHLVHHPDDDLSLRRRDRDQHGLAAAQARLRPGRLRDDAGLLPEQGRDQGPDVPQPQEGPEARRHDPDAPLRLRRVQHPAHARRSARRSWPGWRWAACSPCPTSAAAASTARSGTRPARSSRSRTSSTTSSPRPSG